MMEEILKGNITQDEKLTSRQKMLLQIHLEEPDIRKAAKQAGIGRTTLYRWLKQPAFTNALNRQRHEVYTDAISVIRISATKAIEVLNGLLDSEDEQMRRQVSNDILTHTLRIHAISNK
jgi:transposase-like protein